MSSNGASGASSNRRWAAASLGAGLLLSGLTMLAGLVLFRADRPVLWPPGSAALYNAAYAVAGTFAIFALYMVIYLLLNVVAAARGRRSWGELLRRVVFVVAAITVVGTSVAVCLRVFYWPWAKASAVKTILSNPPQWRLLASARTLSDHWDDKTAERLKNAFAQEPRRSVRAALVYALAAAGEKEHLGQLAGIAASFPAAKGDGAGGPDGGISTREDVRRLIDTLLDGGLAGIGSSDSDLVQVLPQLTWNAREKLYRLSTGQGDRYTSLY